MKSVLISINPKWCELIASGKKTIEVRKTKPKLETPFKVYIYMTKEYSRGINSSFYYYKNGKVVGEFLCDEIYTIKKDSCGWFYGNFNSVMGIMYAEEVEKLYHCIPDDELKNYLGHYIGNGWHISNLVIYDKPRDLSEFETKRTVTTLTTEHNIEGIVHYPKKEIVFDKLTRPPQSWCYVYPTHTKGEDD